MDPNRDWTIGQHAATAPPCTVLPNSWGSSVVHVLMETTHLPRISQVPSYVSTARGATAMTMELSLSSYRGTKPLPKMARLGAFLWVSSRYALVSVFLMWLLLLLFLSLNSKGDFWVARIIPRQL
jgi:hypothetical protein